MDNTGRIIDIIFAFSRVMREKMSVKSDIAQLSMVQLQTLVFLKKNPSSPMRKVAEFLQIELPSATNLIEKLVKSRLVERRLDTKDKRSVKISLTEKGKLLLGKAKRERQKNIGKVLSLLSKKEQQTLSTILEKLTKKMEEK